MSNPFQDSQFSKPQLAYRNRDRFQIGVYAVLGTAAVFLAGLLIQGCRVHQRAGDNEQTELASDSSTSPANTNALATAQTPETNPPAPPVASAPPVPPAPEPAASAPVAPPAPPAVPAPATDGVYVVKRGDTLAAIARSHGTTVKALKLANGLKRDVIVVGKKLKLPASSSPAAVVSRT